MGNVFADLTEEGNAWHDDKLAFPTNAEIISSFEALKPKLVIAPAVVARRKADFSAARPRIAPATDSDSEVADDLGNRCWDTDAGRATNNERSDFVVSRPRYKDSSRQTVTGPRPHRRQSILQSLQSCIELEGHALLTDERIQELQPHLPLSVRFQNLWTLLYSPRVHGVSLGTFYRQCQSSPGETLLLIEDTNGHVFGGFATCTWNASQNLHVGTPQCFVFSFGLGNERDRIELTAKKDVQHLGFTICRLGLDSVGVKTVRPGSWAESAGIIPGDILESMNGKRIEAETIEASSRQRPLTLVMSRKKEIKLYPWAGGDQFFMFASRDGLGMGAVSSPAFWINDNFLVGNSCASGTFATHGPLASEGTFVIRSFECWAFDNQHSLQQANIANMYPDSDDSEVPSGPDKDEYTNPLDRKSVV